MLTDKQIQQIREELDNCKKPLFFFDDDPDGLCAFLLLYRYKREGKGIPVKSAPKIDIRFMQKVDEYEPDKIFIIDVPVVDQEFFDAASKAKIPVIWIDHHSPEKREHVRYFNPRSNSAGSNICATRLCYSVAANKDDIWLAMAGAVGDWQLPEFKDEFCGRYPKLLDRKVSDPEAALFQHPIGRLVKIISFILKGKISLVMKCVKIMTRVEDPDEILSSTTARGKFINKTIKETEEKYDELLEDAERHYKKDEKLLVFTYQDNKMSFTKEMSNELVFRHPDKIIVAGRIKSGEVKLSLRAMRYVLPPIVKKSLEGITGYGGGHEHACGSCVKEDEFEKWLGQFKDALEKADE